jgi:peroxiredoxin
MRLRFPRWLGVSAVALTLAAGIAAAWEDAQPRQAEMDKPVQDFKLKDILSGKEVALSDYKGKPVVLSSISYTCGTSWRYEKRMGRMMANYGKKGVVFVNMNSNANNTEDGMKKYVEARNLASVPLLKDYNNQVADYLNTRVTPTFYVLDKDHVLRYQGSFDDSADETQASKTFVLAALDSVLAGKTVETKANRPFG